MIDFVWSEDIIKDTIDLTDCIELVVAFSDDDYYGRFTHADFIDIVQEIVQIELLEDDDSSFFQGEEVDDFNELLKTQWHLLNGGHHGWENIPL